VLVLITQARGAAKREWLQTKNQLESLVVDLNGQIAAKKLQVNTGILLCACIRCFTFLCLFYLFMSVALHWGPFRVAEFALHYPATDAGKALQSALTQAAALISALEEDYSHSTPVADIKAELIKLQQAAKPVQEAAPKGMHSIEFACTRVVCTWLHA